MSTAQRQRQRLAGRTDGRTEKARLAAVPTTQTSTAELGRTPVPAAAGAKPRREGPSE